MRPAVSVILPTYNRAHTLGRAVDSVLRQTFDDFELIIIDDGSTDESDAVLRAYLSAGRARVIRQSSNKGCAEARNLGLMASRGQYVAFQDSDDEWLPDKLEKAVAALDRLPPECGIFYSDMLRNNEDGSSYYWESPTVRRGVLTDANTLEYAVHGVSIVSAVIRRECFQRVGFFDTALARFIDLDLFIRLSDHFDFFHQREPLVKYYVSPTAISLDMKALADARLYLIGKYYQRLKESKEHLAYQYLALAWALSEDGRAQETYEYASKSLLICPSEPKIRDTALHLIERLGDDYAEALSRLKAEGLGQITVPL